MGWRLGSLWFAFLCGWQFAKNHWGWFLFDVIGFAFFCSGPALYQYADQLDAKKTKKER